MTTTDATSAYVRRPGVHAVAMDDELVMMGMDQGEYYGLRDVAATVWQHLEQPRTLPDLCALVSAEYDVSPEDCRADIARFLDEMLTKKLIDVTTL